MCSNGCSSQLSVPLQKELKPSICFCWCKAVSFFLALLMDSQMHRFKQVYKLVGLFEQTLSQLASSYLRFAANRFVEKHRKTRIYFPKALECLRY